MALLLVPVLPVNGWLGGLDTNGAHAASISAVADDAHLAKLYFDVGATSPSNTEATLGRVIATLQADPGTKARISGYHDATGGAATNEEIAKARALTVQELLLANGIAQDRIVLDKPVLTTGDGNPDEARRVEIRVE
ncbi:OmpA family protein [Pseudoxanthomonas sacheonensis]|uniref:OmpA family protein n=1 Tax=Pseudoxanthomonas sacheonensis TaxID=443615 RepID=UPI00286C409F|nr:OmpA family protein [Pseudoxanthomonas sacheonensis]